MPVLPRYRVIFVLRQVQTWSVGELVGNCSHCREASLLVVGVEAIAFTRSDFLLALRATIFVCKKERIQGRKKLLDKVGK